MKPKNKHVKSCIRCDLFFIYFFAFQQITFSTTTVIFPEMWCRCYFLWAVLKNIFLLFTTHCPALHVMEMKDMFGVHIGGAAWGDNHGPPPVEEWGSHPGTFMICGFGFRNTLILNRAGKDLNTCWVLWSHCHCYLYPPGQEMRNHWLWSMKLYL